MICPVEYDLRCNLDALDASEKDQEWLDQRKADITEALKGMCRDEMAVYLDHYYIYLDEWIEDSSGKEGVHEYFNLGRSEFCLDAINSIVECIDLNEELRAFKFEGKERL